MAQVIAIGEPVNEEERKAIAWLRDHLPDDYYVIHSFEIEQYQQLFEVDLCVIAPHALYVVDAKGVHGRVDVVGKEWRPEGRAAYNSPLPKLRGNAKALSGLISRQNRSNKDLKNIFVDVAVLLTTEDIDFHDPDNRECGQAIKLVDSRQYFTDAARIPDRFVSHVTRYLKIIAEALGSSARKPSHSLRFYHWEVLETLSKKDDYTEYRGFNIITGPNSGKVLLRAYQADPYLPKQERVKQKRLLENAYRTLMHMPAHSAIVGVRDLCVTESQDKYVLVTDDIPGETLVNHLHDSALALTLDQKKRVVCDILSALNHCNQYGVVHRNITQEHILLGLDGQPRLMDFDYARSGSEQSTTIAEEIQHRISDRYKAPELWADASASSAASDIYSFALVVYELFTGSEAFSSVTEAIDKSCRFEHLPSELNTRLPTSFDAWLLQLCDQNPKQRPSAEQALKQFQALWLTEAKPAEVVKQSDEINLATQAEKAKINYKKLPIGFHLTGKYVVQQMLGQPGGFGVVYKVIDTLGDVPRAVKLILQDRHSVLDRLKQEYKALVHLPEHPHVVKVYDADVLPNDGPPYIVFEYIEGYDVGELIKNRTLTSFEVWQMAKQVAQGLAHLHEHGRYHCDIKPQNLIWKDNVVRIIDFNVSVELEQQSHGGGSRKYLPPDLDITTPPQASDLVDRDLYALGITLYSAMTGEYPWKDAQQPLRNTEARSPDAFPQCVDLSDDVAALLLKIIAPRREERFDSAEDLLTALNKISQLRKPLPKDDESTSQFQLPPLADGSEPSKSAYHDYLLTLYSQSRHSNSGTRGLDDYAKLIYVDTALDTVLNPTVLSGELRLVIITGNAGDGKTAFLQQLETTAANKGAEVHFNPQGNGSYFSLNGHQFISNYDGSQDEGEKDNEQVLLDFLSLYTGVDDQNWPTHETRLIAINEGRLVDFLANHAADFSYLKEHVEQGLMTGEPQSGIAVVNLNLRNLLASLNENTESIFDRLIARMVDPKVWRGCDYCQLHDKCYVRYNVTTFQDQQVGPKVVQRLKHLYTLSNLRNQLHITLRDLRSALAYTLVGDRACAEIHQLYEKGDIEQIVQGYYFNSWCGHGVSNDRLLNLLSGVDIADGSDMRLDRELDFLSPEHADWLQFEERGQYDVQLLQKLYGELPSETGLSTSTHRYQIHQQYVAMLRRKQYFEGRAEIWPNMVNYRSGDKLISLLAGKTNIETAKQEIIYAINRGEGLHNPDFFNGQLAMQVRRVVKGSIQSYRVFPADVFLLNIQDTAIKAQFIEHKPSRLMLTYQSDGGLSAELELNLDVFEMLQRLLQGYVPSIEEQQGYYLSLSVFKNVLASAPYQEVLLTSSGHHFQKLVRHDNGVLELTELKREAIQS